MAFKARKIIKYLCAKKDLTMNDLPTITVNDKALARYKAIDTIMRAMRLGALTTVEANDACSGIVMAELSNGTPFFIRRTLNQIMGTLSQYQAKGTVWRTGEHADSGLAYAWRASSNDPGEAEGVSNDPNPDFPGERMEPFINTVTVTVK
jgi:hypothetical protein